MVKTDSKIETSGLNTLPPTIAPTTMLDIWSVGVAGAILRLVETLLYINNKIIAKIIFITTK
jgi:hypothetical protein